MKKNKWLVVSMLMAVVLIFVGCSTPQEPATEEVVVEAVTSEEAIPPEEETPEETTEEVAEEVVVVQPVVAEATEATAEEMVVTETPAVMETEVVLGMLSPDATPVKDEMAPDFALKTLNGEVVQLSDYRGKLVLLNFWTTW